MDLGPMDHTKLEPSRMIPSVNSHLRVFPFAALDVSERVISKILQGGFVRKTMVGIRKISMTMKSRKWLEEIRVQ